MERLIKSRPVSSTNYVASVRFRGSEFNHMDFTPKPREQEAETYFDRAATAAPKREACSTGEIT
jgi:hypothetical protein